MKNKKPNPKPQTPNPNYALASGEVWDDVVKFAVEHQLWGYRKSFAHSGAGGAVAVQNVGAYGQEIKDVLVNNRSL